MKRVLSVMAVLSMLLVVWVGTAGAQPFFQERVGFNIAFTSFFVPPDQNRFINSLVILNNRSSTEPLTILKLEIIDTATGQDVANLTKFACPFKDVNPGNAISPEPLGPNNPFTLQPLGGGQSQINFTANNCMGVGPKGSSLFRDIDDPNRAGFRLIFTVDADGEEAIGGASLNTLFVNGVPSARSAPARTILP